MEHGAPTVLGCGLTRVAMDRHLLRCGVDAADTAVTNPFGYLTLGFRVPERSLRVGPLLAPPYPPLRQVLGLNVLATVISTPLAPLVIAGTRLRGGNAASARGASFATQAIGTARATGCTGILVVRADSAIYSTGFTGAVCRAGAFFSVTMRMDPKVKAAIAAIPETAWTLVKYSRDLG
jgi:hypothetical protein